MSRWPKRKPRPNVDEYGRSSVWLAAFKGDVSAVRRAVASGADPSAGDDVGYTPLQVAVQEGHTNVVRVLLELGAEPNTVDKHGNGPLWTAILSAPRELSVEMAKLLLEADADPDMRNIHGRTPREVAMEIGCGLDTLFVDSE
jgi:ankyrin repeat protein